MKLTNQLHNLIMIHYHSVSLYVPVWIQEGNIYQKLPRTGRVFKTPYFCPLYNQEQFVPPRNGVVSFLSKIKDEKQHFACSLKEPTFTCFNCIARNNHCFSVIYFKLHCRPKASLQNLRACL